VPQFSLIQLTVTALELGIRSISPTAALLLLLLTFSVPMVISLVLFFSSREALAIAWASFTSSRTAATFLADVRSVMASLGSHRHPKVLDHFGH
jgi:hypothetical protein